MVQPPIRHPVLRIEVRISVGDALMAATDDPVFLGLRGPGGREFRLELAHGRSLRRGAEDLYVLGAPNDPATNVQHPELNDPTRPELDVEAISGVYLRKGLQPIPNVRGLGEMDDRLKVEEVAVEVVATGWPKPACFARRGPLWLGLVCGVLFEIPRIDATG